MVFNRQNDKNKKEKADQAAALLTLAKESGAAAGPCLSDEQLAAMIDGRIGDGLQQQFREHLSGCGRCYEVWLLLGGLKKRGVTRGRLVRLSKLRRFSYIGSALAAAASVVVYLNISQFKEPAGEIGQPESILTQRPNEVASPPRPAVKEDKAVVALKKEAEQDGAGIPAAPGAADSAAKAPQKDKTEVLQSLHSRTDTRQEQLPAAIPPAPQREAAKAQAPAAAFQGSSASLAVQEIDESALWLQQIDAACLAGRQELEFWADIRARGEKILAQHSALPKTPESVKIEAVLDLLQSVESSDSVARQCRLIQDELAKDGRSR